ncbi:MAG: anthranilate phosphoribosyltransferase, partial [Deltaproteobacteria bacterium]
LSSEAVKRCIEQIGIGFLFAPLFHPAMKYAALPRREIGIRTIFNILGPLTNPARVNAQVLGVFSPMLTEKLAQVLKRLGLKKAAVVSGMDGMDEVSICAKSKVSYLRDGIIESFEIDPEDFGIKRASISDIRGGDAKKNAEIIIGVLSGEKGPKRDAVLMNASLGFVVAERAKDIKEGIEIAEDIIDRGDALKKLKDFVRFTNEYASLKA